MKLKYGIAFALVVWLTLPVMMGNAFAITVEVAKKCQILSAKAFPPRVPGNPAAGLMHGTGREVSAYFRKCVENQGRVEGGDKKQIPQETK
jgi:hypothetical protein